MAETTVSKLRVSREEARQKIEFQIVKGQRLRNRSIDSNDGLQEAIAECRKWSKYNIVLLSRLFDNTSIAEDDYTSFDKLYATMTEYNIQFSKQLDSCQKVMDSSINSLERIRECLNVYEVASDMSQSTSDNEENADTPQSTFSDEVFIVHGHDKEAKVTVARFVEHLGVKVTILDEEENEGRTIPEKFEEHADEAGYAIVLLTPDDVGSSKDEKDKRKPRARQNVVLEFGYFWGKLGRKRLCVLYKEGVELPSDMKGIAYVPMDISEGWKLKLAREMKQAGLPIDPEKLL